MKKKQKEEEEEEVGDENYDDQYEEETEGESFQKATNGSRSYTFNFLYVVHKMGPSVT